MTIKLTDAEREACAVVEDLIRRVDAAEVRCWREAWYRTDVDGTADVSLALRGMRHHRVAPGELYEVAAIGLADAIERAREVRATEGEP